MQPPKNTNNNDSTTSSYLKRQLYVGWSFFTTGFRVHTNNNNCTEGTILMFFTSFNHFIFINHHEATSKATLVSTRLRKIV